MEKASFRLSIKDYVSYNQRLWARKMWPVLASVILIVGALSIIVDGTSGIRSALVGALAGLAVIALYIFVIVPRLARAIYSETASMSEERTLAVDAQGIAFGQPSGTFRSNWSDIVQWDETPHLLTLFVNRAIFIPITKADISQEIIEIIRQHLIQAGLSEPMRKRSRK